MLGQFDSTQEPRFLTQRHGVFGLRQRSGLRRRGGVTGHAITGTGVPLACMPACGAVGLVWPCKGSGLRSSSGGACFPAPKPAHLGEPVLRTPNTGI